MSVIIRLQNLPWSANALDIRQFFRGLSIPEGGVHIVGGELGDAFIAFSTDEDARQAFQLSNGKIKEVQISLLLSSRTEMQKVIEAARTAQTPFLPVNTPLVTTNQVLLSQNNSNSPSLDPKKDEAKRSKSRERDDTKRSRERSRRRSRSRTRSRDRKDRSRDRRDRRRRDRSRSRDRRDRRRDRRGRSRSRDRTRSRDRDTRRKDEVKRDNDKKDLTKPAVSVWEQKVDIKPQIPALLANFGSVPSSSALEDARRSLGMLTGLQQNINPSVNDMNRFPRNDLVMGGGNNPWPRTNPRFPNPAMIKTENVGVGMPSPLQSNMRPMLGNNLNLGNNQGMNFPPMYTPSNIRGPLPQQDNRFPNNRPFLNGPNMFADQQQQQDRKPFMNNNRNNDSFRDDSKLFSKKGENCVQLRPYYGGYGEVRKFFHGLFIYNTGLKFVTDSNGKRNGTVYVRFVRPDGKEQALTRSGMCLRGVPVEITHLDNAEFERFEEEIHIIPEDSSETDQDSPRPLKRFSCVSVDDLPEFVKEQDILQLFSEYSVLSVHMVLNKQYRPIAYVKFVEEEDAKNAVKKTHVIRGKPVTIKPISNDVYADVLRQQTNGELSDGPSNEKISPTGNDFPNKPLKPPAIISDVVLLSGMPQKTTERDVIDFFSDIGLVPARIHMLLGKFGPTGDCYCELNNPDEAARALDKHEMPLGTGTVRVELVPRREMEKNLGFIPMNNQNNPPPRFQNRFPPRGGGGGGNMMGARLPPPMLNRRRPPRNNDGPFDHMGPPGCVVNMENVPFKASPNEILDFFGNFELNTLNVFRRFNDNGEPTGDARVTFNSPAEARRAVDECNQMSIRNRTIYLRILT